MLYSLGTIRSENNSPKTKLTSSEYSNTVNNMNRDVLSWSRIRQIIDRNIQNSFNKGILTINHISALSLSTSGHWRCLVSHHGTEIFHVFSEEQTRDDTEHSNTLKLRLSKSKLHSIIRHYPPSFIPSTSPYPFFRSSIGENSLLPNKPAKIAHAVLCPLSHQAPPIYMYSNTLKVGTGELSFVPLFCYYLLNLIICL